MSFLFEYIDINPKETIIRGCLAKKIPMDKLQPFCRDIPEYETSELMVARNFVTVTPLWLGLLLAWKMEKQLW